MRGSALSEHARRVLSGYRRAPWVLRGLLVLGWALVIWAMSATPGVPSEPDFFGSYLHNGAHIVLFGVFGSLVFLALPGTVRSRALLAVGAALLYGVLDELHQRSVSGRVADPFDVLTDSVGACWFATILVWLEARDPRAGRASLWLVPVAAVVVLLATVSF